MALVGLTLGILAVVGFMAFRAARRTGRTIGLLAWRVAQGTAVAFTLAVLVYEKPRSFYTNFVIFPSLALYLSGLLGTIVALILGVAALIKRDDAQRGLIAITVSLLAAAISIGLIIWRASDPPRSDRLKSSPGSYARAVAAVAETQHLGASGPAGRPDSLTFSRRARSAVPPMRRSAADAGKIRPSGAAVRAPTNARRVASMTHSITCLAASM